MSKIWYIRVSGIDQNEARQVEEAQKKGADKIFMEKLTGKDLNRPQFHAMMAYIREGDEVYFHEISRAGRNAEELLSTMRHIRDKGAVAHSLAENITLDPNQPNYIQELYFQMFAAFAQFERSLARERQSEGIAIGKRTGIYLGRAPKLKEEDLKQALQDISLGIPRSKIIKRLKVTYGTFRRAIDKFQNGTFVDWETRKKLARKV